MKVNGLKSQITKILYANGIFKTELVEVKLKNEICKLHKAGFDYIGEHTLDREEYLKNNNKVITDTKYSLIWWANWDSKRGLEDVRENITTIHSILIENGLSSYIKREGNKLILLAE